EQRYQSARALRHDLELCREQLRSGEADGAFVLAAGDRAERCALPQRPYGREAEVSVLCKAFEQACQGQPCLLAVAGARGIGKSTLVRELARSVAEHQGCFAVVSIEQKGDRAPYQALCNALDLLVYQLF